MDAFELVGRLTLDSSGVTAGLNAAETKSGFSAWGVTVGNLAARAFSSTFSAATKFARSILETGMDFDAQLSNVNSIKDFTEEEFAAIREEAIELGRTTKYTATEVGEGFYYMGLAGWDSTQMLKGIGPVLDLAAASGEDLGRASDIVTDALTAFGYTADDAATFVDVLAQASANSNTTVSMMGEAFKYIAPVAGSLKYSVQDVAVGLGLLANSGIKASQAGTSLRQILGTLENPSAEAGKAMEELGIRLDDDTGKIKPFKQLVGELRDIYQNADFNPKEGRTVEEITAATEEYAATVEMLNEQLQAGSLTEKDFSEMLGDAQKKYSDYVHFNAKFLSQLGEIGGLRGISSLLAIMMSTDEDYDKLVQSIENSEGAAELMRDKQIDNLQGDITLLNSALDGLKIIVSDKFKDNLREGTQVLTGWITTLSDLIENGLGDTVEKAERKESEAITEANKNANEAQGIIGYLDDLIGKFGDAATKTTEWKEALSQLEGLMPGITERIKAEGAELGVTTQAMREYVEQSRQRAILEAKRKTIGTYEEAYANALSDMQSAQVAVTIAQSQQDYSATRMIDILRSYYTGQGADFTENNEQIYRKMLSEGGSGQLRAQLLNAGEELGMPYESLNALMQSYDKARESELTNSAQIESLTAEMERTGAALELAQAALADIETASLQAGIDNAATAANDFASRMNSASVPSFAGRSEDGSNAKGNWDVPYDNYAALLHRNEMVLTATQARQYREGRGNSMDAATLAQAMRSAVLDLTMELNGEAVGRVFGDQTTRRVHNNISQINRRHRYGYGG